MTVYVPYGKEYTVTVENQEGYYVSFNKNTRIYTATVPQRLLDYRMYQFKAGIFVMDGNLNEYYIDDWVAADRDSEEVVALKVADSTLMINKGTFMIRTSDLRNLSKLPKLPWCTQQLLFTSIASNGNVSSGANLLQWRVGHVPHPAGGTGAKPFRAGGRLRLQPDILYWRSGAAWIQDVGRAGIYPHGECKSYQTDTDHIVWRGRGKRLLQVCYDKLAMDQFAERRWLRLDLQQWCEQQQQDAQ